MIEDGIVQPPISVKDPYQVLGVGATSNGYDVGYICSNNHGKINMWSRFKPVRWKSVSINVTNDQWWKAEDGQCGIDFTNARAVNYTQIPSKMTDDGNNGWEYLPPNGDPFPYRLLDFIKYKHDAPPPIGGFSVPSKVGVGGKFTASVMEQIITIDKDEPGSIAFEDIKADSTGEIASLSDYHLGVYVTDSSGTRMGRVVSDNTNSRLTVTYSVNALVQGRTYIVYPFLAKYSMSQSSTDIANIYYTIPNAHAQEIKIVSKEEAEGLSIILHATYNYDSNNKKTGIFWTLDITSESGYTFTNNAITMRFTENEPLDPLYAGEVQNRLMEISVSPTKAYSTSGSFTINSAYADKDYYVYLSLMSGVFTRKIVPMMMPDYG